MISGTGRQGEKRFSLLCSEAGVTCNASEEDDCGWDHFIEFPQNVVPRKAMDQQPAPKSALVQVKTTKTGRRSWRIRLSNALRMAKSQQPFFLVLFDLSKQDGTRIFVVHMWEKLIAEVLRRARVADAAGATSLRNRWITVKFDDGDEAPDPLARIRTDIEVAGADYAEAKKAIADAAGFEDGRGQALVTWDANSPDDLMELMLGQRDAIKASSFVYTSERFGIAASRPEIEAADVLFSLDPAPRSGILRLSTARGEEFRAAATVYSASIPEGDGSRWAWRVVSGRLDIMLVGDGTTRASASLKFDERVPLSDIVQFATIIAWRDRGVLDIQLLLDGERLDLGKLELKGDVRAPGWLHVGHAAKLLSELETAVMRDDVRVSVVDINQSIDDLEILGALGSDRFLRIEFQPRPDAPPKMEGLLGYAAAQSGGWTFALLAYRPVSEDIVLGAHRRLTCSAARILEARVEKGPAETMIQKVRERYEKRLEGLSDNVMRVGDFHAFVRDASAPQP